MSSPLRALIVEDSLEDAELIEHELRRAGYDPVTRRVDTAEAMREALATQNWDVILADHSMPSFSAGAALGVLREIGEDVPFVIVSGAVGEVQAAETIGDNPDDFVPKNNLHRLAPAIQRAQRAAEVRRGRAHAEFELSRTANTLHNILASATEYAIAATDLNFRVIQFNPGAERLFGHSKSEVLGKAVHEIAWRKALSPARLVSAARIAERDGKYEYEVTIGDANGESRITQSTVMPMRDELGACTGYILIARDITALKRDQQERMRMITAVEQTAEAITITDTDGVIQYVNPAFERITGYSKSEAVGRVASVFKKDDESVTLKRELWDALDRGEVWRGRFVDRRKDGTPFNADTNVSLIRDSANTITSYVVTARDVTREVEIEDKLRQALKMEAVGTLARGIAHDFNNLLTAISGYTDIAKNTLPAGHSAIRTLEMVENAAFQAGGVTKSLMTFCCQNETEKKPINLVKLVAESRRLVHHVLTNSVELVDNASTEEEIWVNANSAQLQQVFINLADNARDAMPEGGRFAIHVERRRLQLEGDNAPDAEAPEANLAVVRLSDTGCGMSREVLARVMEPFFTTKPRGHGTGLGLPIVLGIVSDHGGQVELDSTPGEGSQVTLRLPCCDAAPDAEDEGAGGQTPRGNGELVLVVEADGQVRSIMASCLRTNGYRVVQAADHEAAMTEIQQNKNKIRLIVLDLNLPKRSGQSCVEELRSDGSRVPVILLTTGDEMDAQLPSDEDEDVRVLSKPFQMDELVSSVSGALAGIG